MDKYIFKTERIGFSIWNQSDIEEATSLWSHPDVMKLLSTTGTYTSEQIAERLAKEIQNQALYGVQYWKLYNLSTSEFMGCCGLKPYREEKDIYELGFQLLPLFWNKGYAFEAAKLSLTYALNVLKARNVFAGHHPQNESSQKLLIKLGFTAFTSEFYEPTGLVHPLYSYYDVASQNNSR